MEQHAVPQDITGFKFKLVGDMTLKQFGELAFGAIMAYLFFASNFHPIVKWPLVIFFIILGVGLAFVPIQERPLDTWIINFFKAIYKPTYFTWRKGVQPDASKPPTVSQGFVPLNIDHNVTPLMAADNVEKPVTTPAPQTPPPSVAQSETDPAPIIEGPKPEPVIAATPPPPPPPSQTPIAPPPPVVETTPETAGTISIDQLLKQRQDQAEAATQTPMTIEELMRQRQQTAQVSTEKSAADLSQSEAKLNELTEKNKQLMMKADEIRNQIYNISSAGGDASSLQPELDKLLLEKNQVFSEVTRAREEMTAQRVAPLSTPDYKIPARDMSFLTRPKPEPKNTQPSTIPLTSQANVINGLVFDASGVPLDGVIITIKDPQGNSVRALRSGRLGNFIANTPLLDGEYYLEFEKANQIFDVWKITLNGTVLTPMQIRAKGQETS